MKHLCALALTAALLASVASPECNAQQSSHLWLGGFAGLDLAKIIVTDVDVSGSTFSYKAGVAAGGEFDAFFSDNIGVCAQLAYVQKGTDVTTSDGPNTITEHFTFAYLQLPVLFKATFGTGSIRPVVFAGPEFGFKLSTTGTASLNGKDTTETVPDSVFTTMNIGVMVGAGVTYNLNSSTMLFLNAAYDLGLTNINAQYGKISEFSTNKETDKSSDFRINLGAMFALGSKD